jgi:hypothetical protein
MKANCCYANIGNHPCNCNEETKEPETMKFETWKFEGKRFLSLPTGNSCNVAVMDENGESYGAWYSTEDFRTRQKQGSCNIEPIGTCRAVILT